LIITIKKRLKELEEIRVNAKADMEDKWKSVPVYYFVSNEFSAEKVDTDIAEGEL
jgi:hypothetical protein